MTDLIILGNGMAGMTAALYAKRANLDFKIIGKDEFDFGQIGDAILVDNYPCAAGLSGFDLAMKLHDQLENEGIEITEDEVLDVYPEGNYYKIFGKNSLYSAKTIIYALGASHRKLNCEIDQGISIHYCALCDGAFYKNSPVVIIGGGDSAFSQAEYLSKICSNVHIIMCDHNITANKELTTRVFNNPKIGITYNSQITGIYYDENLRFNLYSNKQCVYTGAEGIFVAIGMIPNTKPLQNFLNDILDKNGYIGTNENCETYWKGIFAAGDVRQKQLRQSITAAADGANAVQSAINYLKTLN